MLRHFVAAYVKRLIIIPCDSRTREATSSDRYSQGCPFLNFTCSRTSLADLGDLYDGGKGSVRHCHLRRTTSVVKKHQELEGFKESYNGGGGGSRHASQREVAGTPVDVRSRAECYMSNILAAFRSRKAMQRVIDR